MDESVTILAVTVGNTRVRHGLFLGGELHEPQSVVPDDPRALARTLLEREPGVVAVASVHEPVAGPLREALLAEGLSADRCVRLGADVPVPMQHTLEDASTLGVDRLCVAYGAFCKAEQACVVVDAGTAITVDFVDGAGTFHGGIIAPGVDMMLGALHERTSALPRIEPGEALRPGPFGVDTPDAMRKGAQAAAVGLVHLQIQKCAEFFGAYPQIVATGGDAPRLFAEDELVEHIVPDLQLLGVERCCRALADEDDG